AMATGSWFTDAERAKRAKNKLPVGWCRKSVNKALCRIRALLKFGVRKKLIPASVLAESQVVEPLRVGRGKARETAPVLPVEPSVIDATLPHLPPVVADMVRVQLATGMRPGELRPPARPRGCFGPIPRRNPASVALEFNAELPLFKPRFICPT